MTIAIVLLVAIVAGVLLFAASRPDSFRIRRSALIRAPAARIFAEIEDFRRWDAWSPWEKLDRAMRKTHSGAARGPGAVYEWEGNGKVGQGRMEILACEAPSRLLIRLDFFKPFEAHNSAEFSLQACGEETEIAWAMSGPSPFVSKLMGLFFNMDRMVGSQFEDGLAALKALAEAG